jgi:hypothetical protein
MIKQLYSRIHNECFNYDKVNTILEQHFAVAQVEKQYEFMEFAAANIEQIHSNPNVYAYFKTCFEEAQGSNFSRLLETLPELQLMLDQESEQPVSIIEAKLFGLTRDDIKKMHNKALKINPAKRLPGTLHWEKQQDKANKLQSTRFLKLVQDTVVFRTTGSRFGMSRQEYTQRIRMKELLPALNNIMLSRKAAKKPGQAVFHKQAVVDMINKALLDNDLELYCSCPAFLYWGFRYIATKNKANIAKYKETRHPDVRNPRLNGIHCKHMSKVIDAMPFLISRIAQAFRLEQKLKVK